MFVTDSVKEGLKWGVPDPILFRISPPLISRYARLMTWYACGRHYDARIDPFELIYVDPCKIEEVITTEGREWFEYSDAVSEVVGGDWDKHVLELEEYDLYNAFVDRFQHGRPWCETDFYERAKKIFERGESKWGCSNIKQFEQRLESMDVLFEAISSEGYKTQSELRQQRESDPALRQIHQYWPPDLHEVSVAVSRKGRYILYEGRHRLSIARISNVEKIPVRIRGRHKKWQRLREYINNNDGVERNIKHKDIKNI